MQHLLHLALTVTSLVIIKTIPAT